MRNAPVQKAPDVFDDEVEDLLDSFPEENRSRLVTRIIGKSPKEQTEILLRDLDKRKDVLAPKPYRSERLEKVELKDAKFGSPFNIKTESNEVGRGDNGAVFEYKHQEREDEAVVFKMFTRPTLSYQNDIFAEGAYQADVATFATTVPELRVGVPQIYYAAKFDKGYALAMEKVHGYSIRDIQLGNIRLPDDFDFDGVEESLAEFVSRMNEAGYYHRDLREGNIMIVTRPKDEKAARTYIIDFGLCTKAGSSEEAYRALDGTRDHVSIHAVLQQLRSQQIRLRSESV